jgi:hypothetical protein
LYWTYGKLNKNKCKENARKMQICIGPMEGWIKQEQRKCKENVNLYWTYGKLNKNKCKENARKMQICIGLMEGE